MQKLKWCYWTQKLLSVITILERECTLNQHPSSQHTHHTLTDRHTQLRGKRMIPLRCFTCKYLNLLVLFNLEVSLLCEFYISIFDVVPEVFGLSLLFYYEFLFSYFLFCSFFLLSCLLFSSTFFLPICKHSIFFNGFIKIFNVLTKYNSQRKQGTQHVYLFSVPHLSLSFVLLSRILGPSCL